MQDERARRPAVLIAGRRPTHAPGDRRLGARLRAGMKRLGYRLAPRLTARMAFAHYWRAGRVDPELYLVPALGDRTRRAVDIGAARGLFAFVMARHFGAVQAFEVDPESLRDLTACLPDNVECSSEALSNEAGEAELPVAGGTATRDAAGSTVVLAPEERCCKRRVQLARLDDQPRRLPVGLVKIEACGRELAICQGAERTLRRDRPVLLVEAEQRGTEPVAVDIDELGDFLLTRGYLGFSLEKGEVVGLERRRPGTHEASPPTDERAAAPRGRHLLFLPEDRVGTLLPRLRRAMSAAPRRAWQH